MSHCKTLQGEGSVSLAEANHCLTLQGEGSVSIAEANHCKIQGKDIFPHLLK